MNRLWLAALVGAFVLAGSVQASTVTVVGSMGGRIWYDGQDVGTIPLRLTRVPPGRHVVRVVTPGGLDRTFDLTYPRGQSVDRVVDMDVDVARREPVTRVAPMVQGPVVPRDDVRYEYVYPSDSDCYRRYDGRDYRSNYGAYPYGYNQPYYGGGSYGYGGYPGYYDTYGGATNFLSSGGFYSGLGGRGYHRDYGHSRSRSSAPSFGSSGGGFAATPPPFSPAPFTTSTPPPGIQGPAGTPTFQSPGTVITGGTPVRSSGQAAVAGQRRPEDQ